MMVRTNPPSEKIKGGYYIKARKIQDSVIAHAPPHVREIWDWLIKEANFKPHKVGTKIIKRGQILTSYKEIQEGLSWQIGYRKMTYKGSQCETAMKLLVKHTMVTTKRTTRGMIVTICNYELYQDTNNYENHNGAEARTTTVHVMKPHDKGIKDNKEINEEEDECIITESKKRDPNGKITNGQFELFWKIYPGKKSDKGKCLSKWKTISGWKGETPPTWYQIKKAISDQSKTDRWKKGMIPLPHTWLNGRRWLDDPKQMNDDPSMHSQTKPNRMNHGNRKKGKYTTDPELKTIKM